MLGFIVMFHFSFIINPESAPNFYHRTEKDQSNTPSGPVTSDVKDAFDLFSL